MRILALLLASGVGGALAQTPNVDEIMAKVGANQTHAEARRKEFVYTQKQTLKMLRFGKVTREEHREYVVTPKGKSYDKKLAHFTGKYASKGKFFDYDQPGYHYKGVDIDGELIDSLSEELTNDKNSRDGLGADLFPLTEKVLPQYQFHLKGTETYRGREVFRVSFEPKLRKHLIGDDDGSVWRGEALIDTHEFQPVSVFTSLAFKMPMAVKLLLGTNITGLGFSVSYEKFDDGVWFPISYGGEFHVRGLFFYVRTLSVSLANTDFRKQDVNSKIVYSDPGNL